jgi:hypothetical protein
VNKRILPAAIIVATGGAMALPAAAFAGSKGQSNCAESFAKWHVSIEQPEGGYVTIDFGRDGVDYTTTVWQVSEMTPLGARFPGKTIRVLWHDADGTVLREKGNGVAVSIQECPSTPTTAPPTTQPPAAPTTTIPEVTTTAAIPTTEVPTTVEQPTTTVVVTTVPVPVETVPTGCPVRTNGYAENAAPAAAVDSITPGCPARVTNERITPSTTPVPVSTLVKPALLLPATGPDQAGPTAIVGTLTLGLGMMLTAFTRRKAARA